jgi:hypothetical protein
MAILRFDNIVEEWARKYKPMQHDNSANSKNKRYFGLGSVSSIPDFVNTLPKNASPAVGCVTHLEGNLQGKFLYPNYKVYFFVKCPTMVNKDSLMEANAKAECLDHAIKFIAWLQDQKRVKQRKELGQIDTENIDYDTRGPLFDNWYACELYIRNIEFAPKCVNPVDYVE